MFADRLKYLEEKHKSQKTKLADAIGISFMALNRYERGVRQPTIDILLRFADFFGVSLDYLLCRTDNPEINR